jgi:translation initiation factor IF-2
MDLSRARGPASASGTGTSTGSPATGAAGDRTRPSATNSRNIRTGFFATPNDDAALREAEEEKKREEKKKRPAAAKEEEVQAFIASDFRKREVIFQPKKKKVALRGEVRKTQITTPKASKRVIKVEKAMTVNALAQALGVKVALLMRKLMTEGITANINTELDFDTIALLVPEFNFEAQNVYQSSDTLLDNAAFGELEAELITRAPVVTVMGHVDHGKTSLLDAIRSANVADKEAGGITQHIGAYKVKVDGGKEITFLDTPGHEAFTQMRARGANVTDIVIVVVAADDGVMPQTAEAINHAKAAGVPIIIAVNKIDKPGINVDRIKQQLTEFQIVPEEWGGTNIFCEVSAVKKIGIKELLSQILLVAELEDLKANLKRSGTGVIIESSVAKGRGPVATLLIQDGTVRTGDNIVVGTISGRIRAMMNDRGEQVREAHAGDPVEIIGLSESVSASDRFDVVKDEETAKRIADVRKQESIKPVATGKSSMTLEELFSKVQAGKVLELNVVLKADVSGSMEALQGMLEKAGTSEVKVKVIHSHIGGINESDVLLAATSGGVVIGFNVRPDTAAIRTAKERHVEIKCYTIIYELIDDVKKAMGGLLKPTLKETIHGRANVREVFSVPKIGNIAGCSISDGKITRSDLCRLLRNGTIIYQGKFSSLKRFKDDVREVATGFECGIGIENFNDIKAGDVIEAYIIEEIAREL